MTGAIYSPSQHMVGEFFFVLSCTADELRYINYRGRVLLDMPKTLLPLPLYSQVFVCY